jgi:phosphate transport system substrate-binding protein
MFGFNSTKLISNAPSKNKRSTVKSCSILMTTLIIFSILASSCGDTSTQTRDTNPSRSDSPLNASDITSQTNVSKQPVEITGDLTGNIKIDGSSTVFPITEAVAEEFGNLTDGNVRIVVGVSGSGGGFKKFCAGETDISNASRPIKQQEVDICEDAGVEYIEIPVALDGLSVMVNPENDFVECVSIKQLNTLWNPQAEGKIQQWDQIDPAWPAAKIQLYGPGVDSGTFDYFTETVNGESQASRGDFVASEDDNVLVHGISGDKGSLGYFGYAYYLENRDKLKLLGIDGGDGCVIPSEETINNGTYRPLSRPVFIYLRKDSALKPHIQEFIRYYLSEDGGQKLVSEVGYIPFPDKIYGLIQARVDSTAVGTLFGGSQPHKGSIEEILSKG